MRPKLHSRFPKNKKGLLNLPVPVPSIPVLNPIVTPLVSGSNSKQNSDHPVHPDHPDHPDNSNHDSPPPAASQPPPASPPPPQASSPSPSNGGSGDDGTNFPSSGNAGSGQSNSGGSSPQNSGSDASHSGSGQSGGAAAPQISVIGSSTFVVTPTGLVPSNNAAANAGSSSPSGDSGSNNPATLAGGSSSDPVPITVAGMQPPTASSFTVAGGPDDTGTTSSSGTAGGPESGSHSHISGGAVGGIVVTLIIVCIGIALVLLRRRHKRRKEERHLEWINSVQAGAGGDASSTREMIQRRESKRSSFGTPYEYRISEAFRRSLASSSDGQEANYIVPSPLPFHDPEGGASDPPVLPMPVAAHSPTQVRAKNPEDPFADPAAKPLRPLSWLPLRLSILSSISGHSAREDPFSDKNAQHPATEDLVPPPSAASSATFGHGTSKVEFPLPPPTPGSHRDIQRDTLPTPGIVVNSPEMPLSPKSNASGTIPLSPKSIASGTAPLSSNLSGTMSYPRHATVQQPYTPAASRRDEVRVERGDIVSIVSVYEDGWAFVQRTQNNERGLVPLTHLAL